MKIDLTLILVALITAAPPTMVALATLLAMKKNTLAIAETKEAVHIVHKQINSRMDQLLKTSKAVSKAEGVVIGRKQK